MIRALKAFGRTGRADVPLVVGLTALTLPRQDPASPEAT
jgi:hypothetical protein